MQGAQIRMNEAYVLYAAVTEDEAQSRHGGTDGLFTKLSILIQTLRNNNTASAEKCQHEKTSFQGASRSAPADCNGLKIPNAQTVFSKKRTRLINCMAIFGASRASGRPHNVMPRDPASRIWFVLFQTPNPAPQPIVRIAGFLNTIFWA